MNSHSILWNIVYAALAIFIVAAIYVVSPHSPRAAEPCGPGRHWVHTYGNVPNNQDLMCVAN